MIFENWSAVSASPFSTGTTIVDLFKKVFEIVEENEKFLILTHDFPDGDGLGSLVAFLSF